MRNPAKETFFSLSKSSAKDLIEICTELANLEEKLLVICIQDQPNFSSIKFDIEKKNLIDKNSEKLNNFRKEIQGKAKTIFDFLERLQTIESTYVIYHNELQRTTSNIYYGKSVDGSDVWSNGRQMNIAQVKEEVKEVNQNLKIVQSKMF